MIMNNEKIRGPQFVQYFSSVLNALKDLGGSGTPEEVFTKIASNENIPESVLNEVLASGQSRFENRVSWAKFYLSKEGFVTSSKQGVWNLTETGKNTTLDLTRSLAIFDKWAEIFKNARLKKKKDKKEDTREEDVAEEADAIADKSHREKLIAVLQALPPSGFERFCQQMLREAGFTQVFVTGQAGDGGIDGHGILAINHLVSLRVLFQCKRYKGSVSPSQVRDFRGAMVGRADKGLLITTGNFTTDAKKEASRDGADPIELIDGEKLLDMLESLELGLQPVTAYEIDYSFFKKFED